VTRRRTLGRAALVLGSVALAIAAAEILMRATIAADDAPDGDDGGWRERYDRMNTTIYRRSSDAALVYEPAPSSSVEMEYGTAGFNAAGMRDDRDHEERGDRRVILLGDSLVWGEFVSLSDSLGRRVERELGAGWTVLNFGVTGYDVEQAGRWYERAAASFEADAVVLVWCMNDLLIMSGPFEHFANAEERRRKDAQWDFLNRAAPVRRETLERVLEEDEERARIRVLARARTLYLRWRFDEEYVDEYLASHADRDRRRRAQRALARLGREIRAHGATPVLVISPVLESWDRYHWEPIHRFVRRAGQQAGFRVLDPLEAWRNEHDPADLRVSGDNLHYDAEGHRVPGRAIAAAVREP
jgi:lysophospholipase L1-like esterase